MLKTTQCAYLHSKQYAPSAKQTANVLIIVRKKKNLKLTKVLNKQLLLQKWNDENKPNEKN